MTSTRKKVLRMAAGIVAVAVIAAIAVLLWLVIIAKPEKSKTMTFNGFIDLPRPKVLNVMDYVSIYGNRLFVTSESSGDVYRVQLDNPNLKQAQVDTALGEGESHGVVVDPNTSLAYVTRSGSDNVDVFDPATLDTSAHIPVADDPDGLFYLPDQKLLYAVSGDTMMATLIDPSRQVPVGSIPLGGRPEFAVYDPQNHVVYQNLADKNEIAVVDPVARRVVDRWPIDGCEEPTGITLGTNSNRVFILCAGNSRFVAMDIAKHKTVANLTVGGGPDAIAFDPLLRRFYVAGKSGELNVLQQDGPDAYSLLETIRTHYGAHTLAVDPATHKVYVAYASLFVKPKLAVFTPVLQGAAPTGFDRKRPTSPSIAGPGRTAQASIASANF